MSYTYSWEKTKSTLDPADFMQEQNDIWEEKEEFDPLAEFDDLTIDFDLDEIL